MIKILHVRNDQESRLVTTEFLKLANYEVLTASNGKDGYDKAIKEDPDVILCDFELDDMGGPGFLYLVQKNDELKGLPFIFLSDALDRQQHRRAMEMGADDFIPRPVKELELIRAIEARMKRKRFLEEKILMDVNFNPSFGEISNQEAIDELKKLAAINHYSRKQPIYKEGHAPLYLYYIHSGKARAYRTGFSDKELTTTLYSPGDFIGYKALLGESRYQENAETLEDSEIGLIRKDDFDQLLDQHPSIAHEFIKILANNINEKEDLLIGLAYDSLRKRVADILLLLLKKYQRDDQFNFTIQISREDLAQMAGTTTESIIRTLSEFKDERIVEAKPGMVRILDEKKLRRMVN